MNKIITLMIFGILMLSIAGVYAESGNISTPGIRVDNCEDGQIWNNETNSCIKSTTPGGKSNTSNSIVNCSDSDGGINYFVKGSLSGVCAQGVTCGVYVDSCVNDDILLEYTCNNVNGIQYKCSNGCDSGVCKAVKTTPGGKVCAAVECDKNSCQYGWEVKDGCITGKCNSKSIAPAPVESNASNSGCVVSTVPGSGITITKCPTTQAPEGSSVQVKGSAGVSSIQSGEVESESSSELEVEGDKIYFNKSNGIKSEIKVMPSSASEKAIERLGEIGFNITLKEVGKGNETRVAYEVEGDKRAKVLGIFKAKAHVKATVDAESGEVISVKKPWWAFLASGV